MKRTLGFVLNAFIIFLIFLVCIVAGFNKSFFNTSYLKEELNRQNVYENIHNNIPEIVGNFYEETRLEDEEPLFTKGEYIDIVYSALDPEDIQLISESAIDSVLPWLSGEIDEPKTDTSLVDLKNKANMAIENGLRKKYDSLPTCSNDVKEEDYLKDCKPGELTFDDILKVMKEEGNYIDFFENIPNTFNFEELAEMNPNFDDDFYSEVKEIRPLMMNVLSSYYYAVISLALMLFIFASYLVGKSWKKFFFGSGVLSIIDGAALLLFALIFSANISNISSQTSVAVNLPKTSSIVVKPLTEALSKTYISSFYVGSIILIIVGFVFLALNYFWISKKSKSK